MLNTPSDLREEKQEMKWMSRERWGGRGGERKEGRAGSGRDEERGRWERTRGDRGQGGRGETTSDRGREIIKQRVRKRWRRNHPTTGNLV